MINNDKLTTGCLAQTNMESLLSLDAHAHLRSTHSTEELADAGAVLAMSLSLDEAAQVVGRGDPIIAWGVGCHPRNLRAQQAFDVERFGELARKSAIIGEIGLDTGSRVPIDLQLQIFRQALRIAAELSRIVSIHSYRTTGLVIDELQRTPVPAAILHWWTGSAAETSQAVALGCYFSIHSAVARHSKFRTRVPPERVLVESDHGYADPPTAIPCRIEWVEHLVAQQFKMSREGVRQLAWQNLARLVNQTDTWNLLPQPLTAILKAQGL
jgi:TatD DNase family protein